MTRREKQRELFIELINYQLKEHGVTYNDVKDNPSWYMEYKTTLEKEQDFLKYCINRISNVLKISKSQAEMEANWFILQWGLTTSNNTSSQTTARDTSIQKESDSTQ
jgi:hypothetical protein